MANKPPLSGPGRGTPRTRAAAHPGERSTRPARQRTTRPQATSSTGRRPGSASHVPRIVRSVGLTRRAIALMVVMAVLLLSYASSLRVYLRQERDLATAQQQIVERTQQNRVLTDEVRRWQDPNFVRAQARQQLGWVVPGEVGYRVVDADGKPLDGGITITSTSSLPQGEHPAQWWNRLAGSLQAADQPLVAPSSQPSEQPVISAAPTPTPTPSAKKKK